ncbi:MAG: hypothetical protein KKB72_00035, partial [Alphaproteobacteria bacterium]|nr:hypothetical protein [Alphaproteobacteria bacterium]
MRFTSSGKTDIAFDGREISFVILILKFSLQHQPHRAHERPDLKMDAAKTEEFVCTRRSSPSNAISVFP